MARVLVLTVIGEDRPGLVESLAEVISTHDGNWDKSRMARLAGHFAGVVQIHLPDDRADALIAALPGLADRGLSASVVDSDLSLVVRRSSSVDPIGIGWPGPTRDRARDF